MNENDSSEAIGFEPFDLHPTLLRGIRDAGFTTPRPIQAQTLPAALAGDDVLGLAPTGTGKTAAFAIPILDALVDEPLPGPSALILAPTRELASQIDAEIRLLAKHTAIRTVTVFGGVRQNAQVAALRRDPDIVVGCPGRIRDLLQQRILRLDRVDVLVIDEADHMFDMGFLPDVRAILGALPEERQSLLFSATMPSAIRKLANDVLHRPKVVEVGQRTPVETIEHALCEIGEGHKRQLLTHVLSDDACDSAIVFTRTKHRARRLADQLSRGGHSAVALQGNMSQNARDRAMQGFRDRKFDILVATDIAARGIDVAGVSHVINFDVPNTPEAYTHRIGRTGRAGREGRALTFVTGEDRSWVRATEKVLGRPIPRTRIEGFEAGAAEQLGGRDERPPRSGRSDGDRPSRPGRGRSRSRSRSRSGSGRSRAARSTSA